MAKLTEYSRYADAQRHADSQALLREAISKARINKFELVEPSLEEIFIQTVGGKADA